MRCTVGLIRSSLPLALAISLFAGCPDRSGGASDAGHAAPDAGADAGADAPDSGSSDAGTADAGIDAGPAGPVYPDWPPVFISAFGLSYDGPVADGAETWVELTVANPAGLRALGAWWLNAATYGYVNRELESAQIPFALAAGDIIRVHGSGWTGATDVARGDNNPAVWDIASTEPYGPNLKHGMLSIEASDGRIIDAALYITGRTNGEWLEGAALAAAQRVVAAGEWDSADDLSALRIPDADREWVRLRSVAREGDSAADWQLVGADPETYYERAEGLTGAALKAALHEIISGHVVVPYSEAASAFRLTDPHPSGGIRQFYTGRATERDFNKEHVWAKSHGGFGSDAYAGYSDLHNLRPTRPDVNSVRWHLDFDEGGDLYSDTECRIVRDLSFEPRDAVKGDVARTLFYMAVRYEGDDAPMPDLELVESIPSLLDAQGRPNNNNHASTPRHGRLSTLLRWHAQDPPDEAERARNEVIFERFQRNRNPFVDHPEWVDQIWSAAGLRP